MVRNQLNNPSRWLRGAHRHVDQTQPAVSLAKADSGQDLKDLHLCVIWEKRTEIENEIMKMYTNKKYSTEKAEYNEGKLITYNT